MNMNREIKSSLLHFVKHFELDIPVRDLRKFMHLDSARKSLNLINHDNIGMIEDFLLIPDVLSLVAVSKEIYSRIDEVRLKIVNWYYPMNTLAKEPTYQWRQLCIDWYTDCVDHDTVSFDVGNIKKAEKTLMYCQKELAIHGRPAWDPLPQTLRAVRSYKAQIICETKILDDVWESISDKTRGILDDASWLYPSGFLSDIEPVNHELYGGMSKEELKSQKRDDEEDDRAEREEREWNDEQERHGEIEFMDQYDEDYDEWD